MSGPMEHRLTGAFVRIIGCLVALLIGAVTVALVHFLTGAKGAFEGEWGFLLFRAILVAAPFGWLALNRNAMSAWIAAAILTAVFWSLPVAYWLTLRGSGGVPIGLGLLLAVSPLIITAGALAADHAAGRRR